MKIYSLNIRRESKFSAPYWDKGGIFSSFELAQKHGADLHKLEFMSILNMEVVELKIDEPNFQQQVSSCWTPKLDIQLCWLIK